MQPAPDVVTAALQQTCSETPACAQDEIITAIADDVIGTITATAGAALPGGEPPAPDQALEAVLATLQQADIAQIAIIIWGEAIRNPALSARLSALYARLAGHFTTLVRFSQQRGITHPATPRRAHRDRPDRPRPGLPPPARLRPRPRAPAFTKGLRALIRDRPGARAETEPRDEVISWIISPAIAVTISSLPMKWDMGGGTPEASRALIRRLPTLLAAGPS